MKREIKFRAWDHDEKIMIYSDNSDNNEVDYWWEFRPVRCGCITGSIGGNQFEPPEPIVTYYENVMQYTGLKDKNGKEIYEGDILRNKLSFVNGESIDKNNPVYKNYAVDWHNGCQLGFRIKNKHNIMPLNRNKVINAESEVIGNIYENPNLLN